MGNINNLHPYEFKKYKNKPNVDKITKIHKPYLLKCIYFCGKAIRIVGVILVCTKCSGLHAVWISHNELKVNLKLKNKHATQLVKAPAMPVNFAANGL